MADLLRELRFALGDKTVVWTLCIALVLSFLALVMGVMNVNQQSERLEGLRSSVIEEQGYTLSSQSDAGSAAYYVFHLAYDPPSPLSYVALGLRNELPWLHRVRMLALEGQIYENDAGNPELASLGDLDFTYLAAIILPLLLIALLYDLDARERRDARFELLCATSYLGDRVLHVRAFARVILLLAAILLPLLIIALLTATAGMATITVFTVVVLHALFWLLVCRLVSRLNIEASTAAAVLLGVWLLLTVLIPISGKTLTEKMVAVPQGGNILLLQRETVNGAWDLPKPTTMNAFISTHPEWKETPAIKRPFEWRWYYAFQQVGDQKAESMSVALEEGMRRRADLMNKVAFLSPQLLTEKWLTKVAKTDVGQHLAYMRCVRNFHAALRDFHYPMLFGDQEYSESYMNKLPRFEACQSQV
ncbi:MAG: DUF3526 domain-containing protein [Pseudomonadales bacterium]